MHGAGCSSTSPAGSPSSPRRSWWRRAGSPAPATSGLSPSASGPSRGWWSPISADGYGAGAGMVVDEDGGVLVGVTMVGMAVGEMLHAATIAVAGAAPLDRLWHAVPSYPTMSEVWLRLLETYGL